MPAPHHLDLETEVRELFQTKLAEFIAFCGENWTLTEKDMQEIVRPVTATTVEAAYLEGYNAALTDGLPGALALWIDEMGYT